MNPATGEVLTGYTVVTPEPGNFIWPIHNCMPVVPQDHEAEVLWTWQDPAMDSPAGVASLLRPTEWDGFKE